MVYKIMICQIFITVAKGEGSRKNEMEVEIEGSWITEYCVQNLG